MKRHSGKVTWFDEKNGFGFLACRHAADVFVDADAIDELNRLLKRGERVLFDIVESDVGPKARSVVRCEGDGAALRAAYAVADRLLAEEVRRWTTTGESGTQTILLIEHDDALRTERSEFLLAAGYLVAGYPDAKVAAEVYRSNLGIDLVMMSLYPAKSLQRSLDELNFLSSAVPVLLSAPVYPLDLWKEMQRRKLTFVSGSSSMPVLLRTVRSVLISADYEVRPESATHNSGGLYVRYQTDEERNVFLS